MLAAPQIDRLLKKLKRFEEKLGTRIFVPVASLPMGALEVDERLHDIPRGTYAPVEPGYAWGGEGRMCWFRTAYTVPPALDGRTLYLWPEVGGHEVMLWVDGLPSGIFTAKQSSGSLGNHYCDLLIADAPAGRTIDIALEAYAGTYSIGSHPFLATEHSFQYTYGGVQVCVKDEAIADFYFDLKTWLQMVNALDEKSFVRAHAINALIDVYAIVYQSPDDVEPEAFRAAIAQAAPLLKALYDHHNASLAPTAAVVGHSHMDTAWHWPIAETIKKCARTYANQISLMAQYPEYRFVQSSAYHAEVIRRHYPALFEAMKAAIATGRYEPNGAVWIECDCNIVGGEMMLRQFLWGQRYTQQHFGYRSDCFWLPDTFGYSASIPQIMKGCGVDYFLTTKISWNDTNPFPYDTFYWQGIDGTKVLSHFTRIQVWPDPETAIDAVADRRDAHNGLREKTVTNMRLLAFGYGDGGGGPQFEMIEMARRCADIEGCPKVEMSGVGDFMRRLERNIVNPSTYAGELYLELHRGTLTNQHQIKRNNRKAEIALHDLEYRIVRDAVAARDICDGAEVRAGMETLLVNQFHDILPGTCIPAVHERCRAEVGAVIEDAHRRTVARIEGGAAMANDGADDRGGDGAPDGRGASSKTAPRDGSVECGECAPDAAPADALTLVNTLPFARDDVAYLDVDGWLEGTAQQQAYTAIGGARRIAARVYIDGLAANACRIAHDEPARDPSPFRFDGRALEAPLYRVRFDDRMFIESLVDTAAEREIRGDGCALGTLLMAEDVPLSYDNWDVDADTELKYRDEAVLLESAVVADGPVEFRLRNTYRISAKSTLTQDVVCYAARKAIRYETRMDWRDDHRLLKAAFDTSIFTDVARQEVQFGHVKRSTTRNTSIEKARFEVVNHKYTSLCENRYGAALLNDCKYGISVEGGSMRLTLHKGGTRPDHTGDHGVHDCAYELIFHDGGFDARNVVRPAYALNDAPIVARGAHAEAAFLAVDAENVIVETIKPCEDAQRAFIVRLYECEGAHARATLTLPEGATGAAETNMLEEDERPLEGTRSVKLAFRPFEIKTVKVMY